MDVYKLKNEKTDISIDNEECEAWLEKTGKVVVNWKIINQYLIFSDPMNVVDILYSEDIDFNEIRSNKRYNKYISKKLLNEGRIKEKLKEGGYIGQLLYNVENDDYEIVVDKEIEKELNVKQRNRE